MVKKLILRIHNKRKNKKKLKMIKGLLNQRDYSS